MENLDKRMEQENSLIRKYLLDQLDETTAGEIDERITTDPNFFERVLLIEQELLEDVAAERLSVKDISRAEAIYAAGTKGGDELAFNKALYKIAETNRLNQKAATAAVSAASSSSSIEDNGGGDNDKEKEPLLPAERYSFKMIFGRYRLVFAALAGGFLLICGLSLVIWYRQSPPAAEVAVRSGIERELAQLNREKINGSSSGSPVNARLQEIILQSNDQRDVSSPMPKIVVSASDVIISFKISLLENHEKLYTAVFMDEQGVELFSVSDLQPRLSEQGTAFISVLVPAKFLHPGDFQIRLMERLPNDELSTAGSSYAFRIIKR